MKNLIIVYKPFLLFLGKFLLSYLLLTIIYQAYLGQFDSDKFEVDGFTKIVSEQTNGVLHFFNCDSRIESNTHEPSIKLFYNDQYIARVIEGCNGLSVIILFIAFIVAFSGKIKTTLLYIIGGSLLIHILNVVRIALLTTLLFHYPEYEHISHGVIFPLFIYGVVLVLWVVWVNKFSKYATNTSK